MSEIKASNETQAALDRASIELNKLLASVFRSPRYRYFGHDGWMYCWTTEKLSDGKYHAFTYKPVGKGARSGEARRWRATGKDVGFRQRNKAKARAWRWWMRAKGEELHPCGTCGLDGPTFHVGGQWAENPFSGWYCERHYHGAKASAVEQDLSHRDEWR